MKIEVLPHYIQIESWMSTQLESTSARPLFIGINAPQGAGKTTLCRYFVERFSIRGLKGLAISIDDFYLTRAEQVDLANQYPGEPLWQARGYPGTHDIALGERTLGLLARGENVSIPRYDKSAYQGKGDRMPETQFLRQQGSLDFVLLEGWMLGFPRLPESELSDENLKAPNSVLDQYKPWLSHLHSFLQIEAAELELIVQWRVQAEATLRLTHASAMSEAQATQYARSFLPAYRTYVKPLRKNPPLAHDRCYRIVLDRDRRPVAAQLE